MICNRCTGIFYGTACDCGWKAPNSNDPMQSWTTFECQTPGCHTVIRERIGATGSQFCRFCLARGVNFEAISTPKLRLVREDGPNITKEEFGENLYECAKRFSERHYARQQYRRTLTDLRIAPLPKRLKLEALKLREADCTKAITELIGTLDAPNVARLIAKYEADPVSA